MDKLRQDVVYAIRSMGRSPGITLAALVCLALGIGASTTTYSATRALVLNPVPAQDSEQLFRLTEVPPNAPPDADGVSPATYLDWEREAGSFEGLAAYRWWNVNLTGTEEPERVIGFLVTPRFFELIGARAVIGRTFTVGDLAGGGERQVVLSRPLWERRFGGDPAVIGRTVLLNGEPHTVSGVMSEDFVFPPGAELWAPLAFSPAQAGLRGPNYLSVFGRLRPGVSTSAAEAEISTIHARIAAAYPDDRAEWTAAVQPIQEWYARNPRPFMMMLMGTVLLVLLIACANVANLLLARASAREREIATRIALGAGRGRIVRQLLTESAVLAVAAGAAGILLALWGVLMVRGAIPAELIKFNPGWTRIRVDASTLGFALLLSVATSLIFGLAPAIQAARPHLLLALREGGRGGTAGGRRRLRSALVVGELALALMLVVSTGLVVRSFVSLLNADLGFQRQHVLSMYLTLPEQAYSDPEQVTVFYSELQRRLTSLPGVQAAGFTSVLPMEYNDNATRAAAEMHVGMREGELPIIRIRTVSDGYFGVLGIRMIAGRDFDARDDAAAPPVAVVSELLARRFWPDQDPIGKRIRLLGHDRWLEVVGVVRDIRHNPNAAGSPVQPTLHVPQSQAAQRGLALVVRAAGDLGLLASATRREITAIDPTLAPGQVYTMDRIIHNALSPQRTTAGMLAAFGLIAVVLACVGVYGVMAYTVRRRADEIGVRMALGARRPDIVKLVLREGLVLVGAGIAFGLVGALALTRTMRAILHEVTAYDPASFALGTLVLGAVALLACWLPARRAARHDPAKLLRYE